MRRRSFGRARRPWRAANPSVALHDQKRLHHEYTPKKSFPTVIQRCPLLFLPVNSRALCWRGAGTAGYHHSHRSARTKDYRTNVVVYSHRQSISFTHGSATDSKCEWQNGACNSPTWKAYRHRLGRKLLAGPAFDDCRTASLAHGKAEARREAESGPVRFSQRFFAPHGSRDQKTRLTLLGAR